MLLVAYCNKRNEVEVKPFTDFKGKINKMTFNQKPYCIFMRKDLSVHQYFAIYNGSTLYVTDTLDAEEASKLIQSGFTLKDITRITYPYSPVPSPRMFPSLMGYEFGKEYTKDEAIIILAEAMTYLNNVSSMLDKELSRINNF